jgi:hypothetical protein
VEDSPFRFVWPVDQDGYDIEQVKLDEPTGIGNERECDHVRSRGGPLRYYRPLNEDGLWLRFAETCKSREGVLSFVTEFGLLTKSPERLDDILAIAALIRRIKACIEKRDRMSAVKLFSQTSLPNLKEAILWDPDKPEIFNFLLIPQRLRDALLHQAGEAITGNRQFRRCRNKSCPNWFRLGPRALAEGRRTYTARRQFCSDRCRVAWARWHKKEGAADA